MTSQIYNNPTSYALLQIFKAMMDGEQIDYERFYELTGYSRPVYLKTIKLLDEMINDLHLTCQLQRFETDITIPRTRYKTYYYKLISRMDCSFQLNEEISEDKRITYFPTIVYLKLKNRQYVALDNLVKYFKSLDRVHMSKMLSNMQKVIGEDLYKDKYKSYVIEEIE